MDNKNSDIANQLGAVLIAKNYTLTTAESCTSGWVGAALTAVKESSRFYSSGFITYTNSAKHRILGVSNETLVNFSAVSEVAVSEMACGAKKITGDNIAIAVSGYAGPAGGEDGTQAGTVWFAWCLPDDSVHTCQQWFSGESEDVINKAVNYSLQELYKLLVY